jgi:hypothetical protein
MAIMPSIDEVQLAGPPGWDTVAGQARIRHVQVGGDRTAVAEMTLFQGGIEVYGRRGVGVWHLDGPEPGELVWWTRAAAACLLPSESALLVLEYGVRIARYSWPGLTEIDEVPIHRYAEDIVVSPSERLFATWLNDGQGATGYELYALDSPMRELDIGEDMTLEVMYYTPVFSPSERLVAYTHGCTFAFGTWWSPEDQNDWPEDIEDELSVPSPGGLTTFGGLVIHDIEEDIRSHHPLQFDLEPGWIPDDFEDGRWEFGLVEPAFTAEDRLRLTLADGVSVQLTLPLDGAVLLPTPGRTLPPDTDDRWIWK